MPPRHANPFHQSPAYWTIVVTVPKVLIEPIEMAFEAEAVSVSSFEVSEKEAIWSVEVLLEEKPDEQDVTQRLKAIAKQARLPLMDCVFSRIESKDWLAAVAQNFPPIRAGRFFVHGSHVDDVPQAGSTVIHLNAGTAFGSGEHATTYGCLMAIDRLARKRDFRRILDMGCGSGILAIAAAKTWKVPVLAVDVDPVSVQVTGENARQNKVEHYVQPLHGDGYLHAAVARSGPYDLILSNILARPLMKFSPMLRANLAPGGIAVLSGLLGNQERMVLAAHQMQGMHLKARIALHEWHTLILKN